jgi:hypothetical protein
VKIALRACPTKIAGIIIATMNDCDDVVDVKWESFELLRKPAVLTTIAGPLSY